MSDHHAFVNAEGQFALYEQDADGNATGSALYLADCPTQIEMGEDWEYHPEIRHGRDYQERHPGDVEYMISIDTAWLLKQTGASGAELPTFDRFKKYVLVVVFWSRGMGGNSSAYVKRIYRSVQRVGDRIRTSGAMAQALTLRAKRMSEAPGIGSKPTLTAALVASIFYVASAVSTLAYSYDFETDLYTNTGAIATSVVGINEGASVPLGDWCLHFDDSVVVYFESGVLKVGEIVALGVPTPTNSAAKRLEFKFEGFHYGSVTESGEFAVRNWIETASQPTDAVDFVADSGGWLFSLAKKGLLTPDLQEL